MIAGRPSFSTEIPQTGGAKPSCTIVSGENDGRPRHQFVVGCRERAPYCDVNVAAPGRGHHLPKASRIGERGPSRDSELRPMGSVAINRFRRLVVVVTGQQIDGEEHHRVT